MIDVLNTEAFGIVLSILMFRFGIFINKKFNNPLLNPLLICIFLICCFLSIFNIPVEHYQKGGDLIKLFLTPSTIILAIPLYINFEHLKKHFMPILIGISFSVFLSFISIFIMAKLFNIDSKIFYSLIPKSITTPLGISLCDSLGGITSITVVSIIITGIFGSIIAPTMMKLLKIKNKIAIGIGIGCAAHA
ncbi:MAG: LrgB family protein, partial [Peptostreptococcaceae bacterium]|nr:LrgB family protein [Peptostreptococcaceae bacterium]